MATTLHEGHSYKFRKEGTKFILTESTDNSEELKTFRSGIEVPCNFDGYAIDIHNDGNNANRKGMNIAAGLDAWNGNGTLINFQNGAQSTIGAITFNYSTVSYGAFTGVHWVRFLDSDSVSANTIPSSSAAVGSYELYPSGSIVSIAKTEMNNHQPIEYCVTSSIHQDKRVFGVYAGSMILNAEEKLSTEGNPNTDRHLIYSLGDGIILVNNQNGNIQNGDYITTASGSGGYGCKQNDDLLHNYTVAKALEDVDWSTESENTKLIACTYHCG